MSCERLDARLDAIAESDSVPADVAAHLTVCPRCSACLATARAIEAALAARPVPAPPPGFTAAVMTRLRRERWRTEQALDLGFNLAVAAGVLLILGGIAGMASAAGLVSMGGDMMALLAAGSRLAADRLAPQLPTMVLAASLLTMTLALWWWVEDEFPS